MRRAGRGRGRSPARLSGGRILAIAGRNPPQSLTRSIDGAAWSRTSNFALSVQRQWLETGYDTGEGVMSSIGLFDTSAQADESTRVASEWVRDEKLESILVNPPKVTAGEVIVHKMNGSIKA